MTDTITLPRELLERAIEVLMDHGLEDIGLELNAVLAQPAQQERKPLTDEQIDDIWNRYCDEMGEASINDAYDIARAIEAAHGITGSKT